MIRTKYNIGISILVMILLVSIVFADTTRSPQLQVTKSSPEESSSQTTTATTQPAKKIISKSNQVVRPTLQLGTPVQTSEGTTENLFNPNTIYALNNDGDIVAFENAELKSVPDTNSAGTINVIFVNNEQVKGIPLKPHVKDWLDSQMRAGNNVQFVNEKFYVISHYQSEPYTLPGSKFPNRVRLTSVETNVDFEGTTVLQTTIIEDFELNKDGQSIGKTQSSKSVTETGFNNEPLQSTRIVSQNGVEVFASQTSYESKKTFWGTQNIPKTSIVRSKGQTFTVDSSSDKVIYNGPTINIGKGADRVSIENGQKIDMSTAREILKDNNEARSALGDVYVDTAKGSVWWPKSFTALDWSKLIGATLKAHDDFKGLSAINSLIKDEEYQDFLTNWKDNVRRHYQIANIDKYLESKICESDVKKMKNTLVVGEQGGKPKGMVRVSAEKLGPFDTPIGQNFQYIITYYLENPHDEQMTYNIRLQNSNTKYYMFVDNNGNAMSETLAQGKIASRPSRDPVITNLNVAFSDYDTICINFHPRIQKFGSSSKTGELCDLITSYTGEVSVVEQAKTTQPVQTTGSPTPSSKAQLNKGFE